MNIRDCIPKDKFDVSASARAKEVGFPMLDDAIPLLLAWVQDSNWPVAEPTASVLIDAGPEIIPHIRNLMMGDDAEWKYWTLVLVVSRATSDVVNALKVELLRLAEKPGEADRREKVDVVARDILRERLGYSATDKIVR